MPLDPADALHLGPLQILRGGRDDLLTRVVETLGPGGRPAAFCFCNAHTAEIALKRPDYAAALSRFLLVNDGIGLEIAAKILEGRGFPENLNGTDFTPWMLENLERPVSLYLLGAEPGIAAATARIFAERYSGVRIVGARDGYFPPEEEAAIVSAIEAARPDILLVALGNPGQELFIARHFEALGAKAMFGVGALFDFMAGKVVRAPIWVQRARLEWAFRLMQEPGRLVRRYTIETASFLIAVTRLRLSGAARRSP